MVTEPAPTPVTTPVDPLTVAMLLLEEVQVPPVVGWDNCKVEPALTVVFPVI
jgi:hypothetical protein